MDDREIFEKLLEIGKNSKDREGVVVAGLIEDGKIIAASPSADDGIRHAEDLVIEMAKKNSVSIGESMELYTTVESCTFRNPKKKMIPCATLIINAGIKKVIFAAHDPRYKHDSEKILRKAGVEIRKMEDRGITGKALEIYYGNKNIKTYIGSEINIFRECYQEIKDITGKPEDEGERDNHRMELECFLLHARNLIDFLCDKGKFDTDVLISNFVSDRNKISEIKKILDFVKPSPASKLYKRINIQLSHISYKRLNNNEQEEFFSRSNKIYEAIDMALKICNSEIG